MTIMPLQMCHHNDAAFLAFYRYYRGRGAFESMGAGIDMAPGDIAFKCNFATLDTATKMVIKRRADRHFEDVGPELCNALDGAYLRTSCKNLTFSSKGAYR